MTKSRKLDPRRTISNRCTKPTRSSKYWRTSSKWGSIWRSWCPSKRWHAFPTLSEISPQIVTSKGLRTWRLMRRSFAGSLTSSSRRARALITESLKSWAITMTSRRCTIRTTESLRLFSRSCWSAKVFWDPASLIGNGTCWLARRFLPRNLGSWRNRSAGRRNRSSRKLMSTWLLNLRALMKKCCSFGGSLKCLTAQSLKDFGSESDKRNLTIQAANL